MYAKVSKTLTMSNSIPQRQRVIKQIKQKNRLFDGLFVTFGGII